MSTLIERVTGSRLGGTSEQSIRLGLGIIRLGPVLILLLLVMVMTLLSPVFFSVANVSNVVVQTSVLAVLAIGQLFVILVAGIDLSVGSVLGLATVADDVSPELALETIASVEVLGAFRAPGAVKAALAPRTR